MNEKKLKVQTVLQDEDKEFSGIQAENPDARVALVLGAVKGIGREIALYLARSGVHTAMTWYDWEEELETAKKMFAGTTHSFYRADLRDPAAVHQLIRKIILDYGRLDILINNIERGGWPVVHGPYLQRQWDLEAATTLRAKWWVFDEAFPYLKNQENASVINISSIAAIVGRSGPAGLVFNDGYSAFNRGVSLLTETWARMAAPNVRVNEIMLGFFETRHAELTRGWSLLTQTQKQAILDHTLLGRTGKVEEVVKAVRFLLEDGDFITGTVLRIDGGYVLGGEPVPDMPDGEPSER